MDLEETLKDTEQSIINEEILEMLVMIEARQLVTHSVLSKIYAKLFDEDPKQVELHLGIEVNDLYEKNIEELEKRLKELKNLK